MSLEMTPLVHFLYFKVMDLPNSSSSVLNTESALLMIRRYRSICAELVLFRCKHYQLRRWNVLYEPGQ